MFATPITQSAVTDLMTPAEIERRFRASQARLMRLARLRGASEASAEDVVQETWLEAWKSLSHLRDASHFDAWLDGICRNVCRRQVASTDTRQSLPLRAQSLNDDAADLDETPDDLADTSLLDPMQELDH